MGLLMRTFTTEFDLEIIYVYVLYKATQNTHSFNRNSQNHTFSHCLVATLAGYGRMLGVNSLFTHSPWWELGASSPPPPTPGIEWHILLHGSALGPKLLLLTFAAGEPAASPSLRLSLWWWWKGKGAGREDPTQIWTPKPCGWDTMGLGTSDFLDLGSLRASRTSSHPVPFTPGLFYCFITFFRASVAKDADGAILHFLTLPNPKSCCFKQFGHLQRLPFQI